MSSHPPEGGAASNDNIMMLNSMIGLFTRVKNYDIYDLPKDQPSTSQSNDPLNIEKAILEPFPQPPKGAPHWNFYNPNARAAQHYSIVEDLAQAPCAMSALEVLQSFRMQQQALLSAIGGWIPQN
jgi:hypothetical protein